MSLFSFLGKDVRKISKFFVNHKAKDSHHCSSAIVQFDATFFSLPLITLLVPSVVNPLIAEVTLEVGFGFTTLRSSPWGLELILVGGLHHGNGGSELGPDHTWNLVQGGESSWDSFSTWESDTGVGDKVTNNCQHGDASMLEFDPSLALELFKLFLGGVGGVASAEAQGIKESKRGLGTDFLGQISVEGGAH